jgi:hypothetical protein
VLRSRAARRRIILVASEPKKTNNAAAAPAPTATARDLMLNIGGLSKMSQTATVSYLSYSISEQFKSVAIIRKNCPPKGEISFVLEN